MNIDWSKAPEGATHGREHQHGVDFYKREDGLWLYFTNRGKWDIAMGTNESSCESRPLLWNGKGLPPVGTVCEMQDGIGAWTVVEIFAVHCGYAHGWDSNKRISYFSGYANEFRPIRTPEQIAAEERLKAIDEMAAVYKSNYEGHVKDGCQALYDAGYRLQVAP